MTAKYLVRFDDICSTMKWSTWDQIEQTIRELDIRPLVGVIPDNHYPRLQIDPPLPGFWDRVAGWAEQGWAIGVHGYRHTFVTKDAGIVGINPRSEFAGVARSQQAERLGSALEIFRSRGIEPEVWMAPANSLDRVTVELVAESGIRVISDGLSPFPYKDPTGVTWVPQQMWQFRSMPFGVWTVALHTNFMTPGEIENLRRDLGRYHNAIVTLEEVLAKYGNRKRGLWEMPWEKGYRSLVRRRQRALATGRA